MRQGYVLLHALCLLSPCCPHTIELAHLLLLITTFPLHTRSRTALPHCSTLLFVRLQQTQQNSLIDLFRACGIILAQR